MKPEVEKKPNRHFATGEDLCKYVVATHGSTVILGFSAGKDSVAAWLQLRRFFKEIIPVYLYYVPGLEFVEDNLRYYERFFGTRIIRLPEQSLYGSLANLLYQPPERVRALNEHRFFRHWTNAGAIDLVREWKASPTTLSGDGIRMSDSMRRRFSIQRHGSIYPHKLRFFPVFDWTDARVEAECIAAKVKLASDYQILYRTFEGPRYAQLVKIRDAFPRDYDRILEWFPLAKAELLRRQWTPR